MIIYEKLSRKNIDQYILYLKKALSEEPDMLWVEQADETGIKARINDPFYQNTKSILAIDPAYAESIGIEVKQKPLGTDPNINNGRSA